MRNELQPSILCLATEKSGWTQTPVPFHKTFPWFGDSGDHPLTSKLAVHFDGGLRQRNVTPSQKFQVRPGISYKIDSTISIAAAYGYFRHHLVGMGFEGLAALEHGMHRRINLFGKLPGSGLPTARKRLSQLQYRLRNRLRTESLLQLAHEERTLIDVSRLNRVFLRFQAAAVTVFDQNRAFRGLGYQAGKGESIETGIFNRRFQRVGGGRLENNNVLCVTVSSAHPMRQLYFGRKRQSMAPRPEARNGRGKMGGRTWSTRPGTR